MYGSYDCCTSQWKIESSRQKKAVSTFSHTFLFYLYSVLLGARWLGVGQPRFNPSSGRMHSFFHTFMPWLALKSIQPPLKWVSGLSWGLGLATQTPHSIAKNMWTLAQWTFMACKWDFFYYNSIIIKALWPNNLEFAFHCWDPKLTSLSLHMGFIVDELESGHVLLEDSPICKCHKFHFITFSIFISSNLFISFHPSLYWCYRSGQLLPFCSIDL